MKEYIVELKSNGKIVTTLGPVDDREIAMELAWDWIVTHHKYPKRKYTARALLIDEEFSLVDGKLKKCWLDSSPELVDLEKYPTYKDFMNRDEGTII